MEIQKFLIYGGYYSFIFFFPEGNHHSGENLPPKESKLPKTIVLFYFLERSFLLMGVPS